MTPDETQRYITSLATELGIEIHDDWMPNVIRFFDVARAMAADVIASGALTDAEGAPVFVPRSEE